MKMIQRICLVAVATGNNPVRLLEEDNAQAIEEVFDPARTDVNNRLLKDWIADEQEVADWKVLKEEAISAEAITDRRREADTWQIGTVGGFDSEKLKSQCKHIEEGVMNDKDADGNELEELLYPLYTAKESTIKKLKTFVNGHDVEFELAGVISTPLTSNDLNKNGVSPQDAEWLGDDIQQILEIMKLAHILNCRNVEKLCAAGIASMLIGKNTDQMRETFGIPTDAQLDAEAADLQKQQQQEKLEVDIAIKIRRDVEGNELEGKVDGNEIAGGKRHGVDGNDEE